MKICVRCGCEYPSTEYRKWSRICNPCARARANEYHKAYLLRNPVRRAKSAAKSRAWALANPDRVRANGWRTKLRLKYGLTTDEHAALLLSQNGKCAFLSCDRPATDTDHIDINGRPWVRGILCNGHNLALGVLHDNVQEAEDAAEYLRADARRRTVAI